MGDGAVGKTCLCTVYTQVEKFLSGLSQCYANYHPDYHTITRIIYKNLFPPENIPNELQSYGV